MSLQAILLTYLAINILMTIDAMILDIRLQRALGFKSPVTQTLGAFVLCALLMLPMRLYMATRRKRRVRR